MSNEQTPILSGAIPLFEMFMTRWENLIKKNPGLEPIISPGLECAYMYYGHMDRMRAYIIAMCTSLISDLFLRQIDNDIYSIEPCYSNVLDS